MKRRFIVIAISPTAIIASGGTYLAYAREMQIIRDRLPAGSRLMQTRYGPIEYATWGNGPAVLVVHGAGGGYDQGTGRTGGLRNEGAAINPDAHYSVEEIKKPTLVVHSRDDHINPFAFGGYTAQHNPRCAVHASDGRRAFVARTPH